MNATTKDTSKTSAPRSFSFELETGLSIPEDLSSQTSRPNVLVDEFFTPALARILADESGKTEPTMFFPVAFFQQGSDAWHASQGKTTGKTLTISDARQKLNDAFKKFQKAKATAAVIEIVIANRTGKEGDPKATEPGVRAWLRMKKH